MRKASRTTAAMDKPSRAPKLQQTRGEEEKKREGKGGKRNRGTENDKKG